MSAWAGDILEAIVEPKRSSIPRVMGPSKILCDMWTGGVHGHVPLYTPPMVYTIAYIHYRRSFTAHTSGGPEISWGVSAWARGIMSTLVEPKRSSIPRVMGPSRMLSDM